MFWKLITVLVTAFILTLFVCGLIITALQKGLSMRKYKLTKRFSYMITCLIVLILGIVFGKEFLYFFL